MKEMYYKNTQIKLVRKRNWTTIKQYKKCGLYIFAVSIFKFEMKPQTFRYILNTFPDISRGGGEPFNPSPSSLRTWLQCQPFCWKCDLSFVLVAC